MAVFIQYQTRDSLYDGPFDSKAGWSAAGMGDVIVTEAGRLIVVDGGMPNDAEGLLALLREKSKREIPEVEFWIVTHAHADHYGALERLAAEAADRLRVKRLCYWFPEEFCNVEGKAGIHSEANAKMKEIAAKWKAAIHRPERGERIVWDDVTLEFYYVPDDCSILNTVGSNVNYCSLIFAVNGKRRRVLVTGDAYRRTMQITVWRYGDKLKCDILQMPHHALCDSHCEAFYRCADPSAVLMPISVAGYRAMHSKLYDSLEGCKVNLCLEAKAKEVIKAFEGSAELEI